MKFLIDMPVTPDAVPHLRAQAAALDLRHSIVVVDRRRIRRRALPVND